MGPTSSGGSGACSHRKFEKLDTSDWPKLTFLNEKKNRAKFMNPCVLFKGSLRKIWCSPLETIEKLLFPLSAIIFLNVPPFSASPPPHELNNDNSFIAPEDTGTNSYRGGQLPVQQIYQAYMCAPVYTYKQTK